MSDEATTRVPGLGDAILEAAENAGVGVVLTLLSPELRHVYVSPAAASLVALSVEEMKKLPPLEQVAPDARAHIQERVRARLRGEKPVPRFTTLLRRHDGVEVPVEIGIGYAHIDGQPASVLFLTDISEASHAQKTLERSESRFRALIEAAPDAILISRRATVLYANPAAAALFGYESSADLVGEGFDRLLHAEDFHVMAERIAAIPLSGPPLGPREYRARTRDGRAIVIEVTSVMLEDADGPAIIGFARDVTESRRMEAQLMRADRLAALGTMAAGVAHEINNPLAFMMLGLDAVQRQLNRAAEERNLEAVQSTLADVRHGVERIAAIVRQLRAFSRSSDSPARAIADLGAVLHSAARMAAHEVRRLGTLVVDVMEQMPPVRGESSQLEQVFLNLFINAAQALREDRTDGLVEVRARARDEQTIEVVVRDNGRGIAADDLTHIFDPFFTTKPIGTGTGLGLSICHTIVSSLGGEIAVESRIGEGTSVRVVLPILKSALTSSAPPQGSRHPPLRSLHVLVADDEPAFLRAMERLLSPEHVVWSANSAEEALSIVADHTPDAILLDVTMPGVSGMELFETIRARRPELERRIVFVTGGALQERLERTLAKSGRPILQKPFDAERITALLSRIAAR